MNTRPAIALIAITLLATAKMPALAELRVLSAVGMRQVILELAPRFERASGHRVMLTFESSGLIVKRLQNTAHADVVLINDAGLARLVRAGLVVNGSARPIATSQVGVAVRSGAPKPDISTPAAFTRALLAARMVTYPDAALEGSSGVHLAEVMTRLGIAAQMKARTIYPEPPGPGATTPGSLVAAGKADIALHQIQELIAVRGIDIVGPLPDELQQTFTFSAAVVRGSVDVAAATALTEFLRTSESRTVIAAKGMGVPAR